MGVGCESSLLPGERRRREVVVIVTSTFLRMGELTERACRV